MLPLHSDKERMGLCFGTRRRVSLLGGPKADPQYNYQALDPKQGDVLRSCGRGICGDAAHFSRGFDLTETRERVVWKVSGITPRGMYMACRRYINGTIRWGLASSSAPQCCVALQDCRAADSERGPERAAGEAAGRMLQLVVPQRAGHPGPPALDRPARPHRLHPTLPGRSRSHRGRGASYCTLLHPCPGSISHLPHTAQCSVFL